MTNTFYLQHPKGFRMPVLDGIIIGLAENTPTTASLKNNIWWRAETIHIHDDKAEDATFDDILTSCAIASDMYQTPSDRKKFMLANGEEQIKLICDEGWFKFPAYEHFICILHQGNPAKQPDVATGGLLREDVYFRALLRFLAFYASKITQQPLPDYIVVPEVSLDQLPVSPTQKLFFYGRGIAEGSCAVHLHNRSQLLTLASYMNATFGLSLNPDKLSDAEIEVFEKFCIRDGQFVRANKADWDTFVDARELMRLIDHVNQGIGRGLLG